MRLRRLKVTNFRCFLDETAVDLETLIVLVGKNDAGKSSLLDALEFFFNGAPEQDDRCVYGTAPAVRIACVFDGFPKQIVIDEQHPTDLASEFLLNEDGLLELVKVFECGGSGKVKAASVFARANHPSPTGYDDLLALTNAKLKQRAKELGVDLSSVNQTINSDLRRAIWTHGGHLNCAIRDIPLKSEAGGSIWEQLKTYLPLYALFKSDRASTDQDDEAQDPMKAAVKEAIKAQEEALEQISARVKQEVQEIANRTVEKIQEMNPELAKQLTPRVVTKNWDTLFSVSLTGDDEIPMNKRGSGTRRLVLLNFFRAKAERAAAEQGTGVIYAIEEPETSQHPNNQNMLVEAFEDLADRPGCQVLLTTHTPVLAKRFPQHTLRHISRQDGTVTVGDGKDDGTLAKIVGSLGVLPDHNIRAFVGVEGRNDIAFLTGLSKTLSEAGEDVPDLGMEEERGRLVFIPLGGSNLDLWVSRLREFNRPEFYLMDRDTCPPAKPKYWQVAEELAKRASCTVWTTTRREIENYLHPGLMKAEYALYAGTGADFEDVPMLFARAVHETSPDAIPWEEVLADPEKLGRKISNAKRRLNSHFVGQMTPELLSSIDAEGEVRSWLHAIGEALSQIETSEKATVT